MKVWKHGPVADGTTYWVVAETRQQVDTLIPRMSPAAEFDTLYQEVPVESCKQVRPGIYTEQFGFWFRQVLA